MVRIDMKKKRVTAAEKKRRAIREVVWPGLDEELLWRRLESTGFITIPRTLPLIVEIINCMTKGAPAGTAYFELWCRSFDECFVDMDDEDGMAFSTGFTGQRATSTWRGRVRALQDLGFVDMQTRGGKSYALIFNPYQVIYRHYLAKTPGLTVDHYSALEIRVAGIGANDLSEAKRMVEEKTAATAKEEKSTPNKAPKKPSLSSGKAK